MNLTKTKAAPIAAITKKITRKEVGRIKLSIIVPVYNEVESLQLLFGAIEKSVSGLDADWELILVDDGSKDGSLEKIREIVKANLSKASAVVLRRNFGQTAAIAAGIDHASGDVIVLLDADLQNDPADIPLMIEKINEGYDVVSGWRYNRQDSFITRTLPSQIANWLISKVTHVKLHDYGCTLKAYRREVLTGFRLYGEMHRFIPAYANSFGAKITEVKVHHHPRKFGKAKYGLERTIKVVLDLFTVYFLTSFASKPIYLFGGAGIFLILVSVISLIYLGIRRIVYAISPFTSPLFIIAVMVAIMGFQSILMGLIAELLARTYHESQDKPIYTIREVISADKA
ncbi:MAG: glycosyltransferase family 2 protein [Pelolinea sp.]|nr:glycosyltransferase family 2 protein [Pelolinea sp.]